MRGKKNLSEKDKLFINDNKDKLSINDIAEKCGTTPNVIKNYIDYMDNPMAIEPSEETNFRGRLLNSFEWRQIKKQFSTDETDVFQERYIQLMEQFKDDVEKTEEKQILELIKIEINMDRNHEERERLRDSIRKMQKAQKSALSKAEGEFDQLGENERAEILKVEELINASKSAESSKMQEWLKLQEAHSKIIRDLKGTRDQRIKQIESGNTTFVDLVKQLQNRTKQEEESKITQLLQMASDNEYKRLSQPIQYADELLDRPILSIESLGGNNE